MTKIAFSCKTNSPLLNPVFIKQRLERHQPSQTKTSQAISERHVQHRKYTQRAFVSGKYDCVAQYLLLIDDAYFLK